MNGRAGRVAVTLDGNSEPTSIRISNLRRVQIEVDEEAKNVSVCDAHVHCGDSDTHVFRTHYLHHGSRACRVSSRDSHMASVNTSTDAFMCWRMCMMRYAALQTIRNGHENGTDSAIKPET